MAIRAFFPTLIYHRPLGLPAAGRLSRDLADECASLAASDDVGRRWSGEHYLGGYTSYGSHDRLHLMSSLFAGLQKRIDPHVRSFTQRLGFEAGDRPLAMTDCWVNVMPAGVVHSLHLHPGAVISGTYYVAVPRGAGALKFEDPRLSRMMAAPPRKGGHHVSIPARAGDLILFESWLRHEVPPARFAGKRVSISFNYAPTTRSRRS